MQKPIKKPIFMFQHCYSLLLVFILQQSISFTFATKCIVSRWQDWSECMGNCEFGLRVRNRDIIRPPFPEKSLATGQLFIRECPPLYEIENCLPQECEDDTPFINQMRLSSKAKKQNVKLHSNINNNNSMQIGTFKKFGLEKENRIKISGTSLFLAPTNTTKTKCGIQNARCCKITRTFCPDGSIPKQMQRWHRLEGEQFCRPYNYPYCGTIYDNFEDSLQSETSCLNTCFNQAEKTIFPSLKII